MRKRVAYLVVLLGTAACVADPTGTHAGQTEPRYDGGGWTIGSGRADSTATLSGSTTSADTCTTAFGGGWTIGSGVTQPSDPCPDQ